MKTVIVTGAAGFIGSHTVEKLLKKGYRVAGIDNFNDFYDPQIKRSNIKEIIRGEDSESFVLYEGDICDCDFISKVFEKEKPDSVIHCAAYAGVRPSISDPSLYAKVNVEGLANVLTASKELKSFVFASSSSVYGNNEKLPFSESDNTDNPVSPYAATKKAGEMLCRSFNVLYKMNIACLRFFTVYGPRQRPDLAIHKFTKLIDEGNPIAFYGDGSTKRDYTYIDDITDGVLKALEWTLEEPDSGKFEIFNLGESDTISLSELVSVIEKALGKKAVLDRLPLQPGDVQCTYADISKSKRVLGYDPHTTIEQGLAKFMDWYKTIAENEKL